jgi:23S rRNA pseudouridine2605 synthase
MGLYSRSQATEIIHAGRVRLNGAIRRDPETPVNLGSDRIEVDERAAVAADKVYLVLNKPRGVVTTASDEKGRQTVYDILRPTSDQPPVSSTSRSQDPMPWVAPVGRLDKASEGLLLLTNDSEWAARILAPATHLEKTYHVQISQIAPDDLLASMRKAVESDGEMLRVRRAHLLRSGERNCWLEVVLGEGKNRHIRRMLEALGVEVLRLVRVAIGPLTLGDLAKGASRNLSPLEKAALDRVMKQFPG